MTMGVPTAPKLTGKLLNTRQMMAAAHGGKAEGQQEWGGERRGGAETGRAFDEGGKHVSYDDRLNALVAADVLHPVLDGFHAARSSPT